MSLQTFVEKVYGKPIKELLYYYYIEKDMSLREVAAELSVNHQTVANWLRKHHIAKHKNLFD